jgi:molecular chaperone Hsp33
LVRLFHEETPRVFDAQPVQFGCTCSAERVRQSLSIYSAKDIGAHDDRGRHRHGGLPVLRCALRVRPATLGFEAVISPGGNDGRSD